MVLTVLPPLPPILISKPKREPQTVACNHFTDLDFLSLLISLHYASSDSPFLSVGSYKILLKSSLLSIPVIGFGIQLFGYLPLSRSSSDLSLISSFNQPKTIIFPEGTTLNSSTLKSSFPHASSRSSTWFPLQTHLLYPRYKGLKTLTKTTPSYTSTTIIYKGYSGEIPSYELGYDRLRDRVLSFKILLCELPEVLGKVDEFFNGVVGYEEYGGNYYRERRRGWKVKFDEVEVGGDFEKVLDRDWKRKSHYIDVNKAFVESGRDSEGNVFVERRPAELRRYWIVWVLGWAWAPVGVSYFIWLVCGGWMVVAGVLGWKALVAKDASTKGKEIVVKK
ncbi:hypothetical protein TrVE_jg12223 [Triparma verrucosa]|uniref:Phospholipid/glycerol acyltransferase domain-containing protein n=1 Tax=Triparma verrucosa TaxID=1606542 RepID=A0A9W7C730_9STRA|nr:hypothetical protein TrVE_jg12223 [Triparma verrucosa]